MKLNIEFSEEEIRELIVNEVNNRLPNIELGPEEVKLRIDHEQYKVEWPVGSFRATINRSIP